jgi:hypothetical protein
MNSHPLTNWIPYKITNAEGQTYCHWLNTFQVPFTDPFFESTLLKCRVMENRYPFEPVSNLEALTEWAADIHPAEPVAFIFHISRCGSTLVSQLLAASAQHIVLSEAPFFDDILRLPFKNSSYDEQSTSALFSASLRFYGQQRMLNDNSSDEIRPKVFIKSDCWHLFFYEQLRRLYPSVPFIAIYRTPDYVYHSHKKMPGMHIVPGLIEPELFGFEPGNAVFENHDTYLAGVLERYLVKCTQIAETDDNFLLVNYNEGPMQMIKKIAAFANISLSSTDLQTMEERSLYHSKNPGQLFNEERITDIPPVLDKAMEAYRVVDQKRLALK